VAAAGATTQQFLDNDIFLYDPMTDDSLEAACKKDAPIVFVVDDDPDVRDSVAALVCSKGMKYETYASSEEFLEHFDRSSWGCLVADVRMMGMTGLELQQRLLDEDVDLPVIVITGFGNIPSAITAMRAGAVTFLEKPCPDTELWKSISDAIALHEKEREMRAQREQILRKLGTLTPQERIVMERVVAGRANKVIASELDIGLRTVELRRANALKKMDAKSVAELVRMVVTVRDEPE